MKAVRNSVKLVVGLSVAVALSMLYFGIKPVSPSNAVKEQPLTSQQTATPPPEPSPQHSLRISSMPSPGDSDEQLLRLARELVAQSPEQSLTWAAAQQNALLRERLLFTILRAWGEKDPKAAVGWALEQDEQWRFKRMEAALTGAVAQPAMALEIGRRLLADDTKTGSAYGTALIGALSAAGQFQTALQFANEGPLDSRTVWLNVTFTRWAQSQPEDAVKALALIQDESSRTHAFQSLADGWSASDPSALAGYVISLPDGKDRTYAIDKAIDIWSLRDPTGLATWLNTLPRGPVFDAGAAMIIAKTDGANRTPEVAMQWVENIADAKLRYDSLLRVLGEWNQTEPAKAQQYVTNTSWLDQQQQQEILTSLQSPPPNLANGDTE